ncbi:MAG: six-cysteine ranthipeptide SCIFF [Firmicutes bacterium]|nr:six-cysteine ranthipeptide SCIFF [Bacillota bacterium]
MKHIQAVAVKTIKRGEDTGCGKCRSSCQSACKTSCTVGNQSCEKDVKVNAVNGK